MFGLRSDFHGDYDNIRRGSGFDDLWLSKFLEGGYKKREDDERCHQEMKSDLSYAAKIVEEHETSMECFTTKSTANEQQEHKSTYHFHSRPLPKSPAALAQAIRNAEMERYIQSSLNGHGSTHHHHHHHHHRRDGHHGQSARKYKMTVFSGSI